MTIDLLDLEVVLDYDVEKVHTESGSYFRVHWKSIKAISQDDDARLCDMVEILPLLHRDQITEIEAKLGYE